MSYERLAATTTPTVQPARVSFYYPVEQVFNDASLRSMYQAKAIKNDAGDSLVDQFAITEDERVIHLGLMEDAIWDIFTNFLKYTKSISTPIAHNESYINSEGVTVIAVKQKETISFTGAGGLCNITGSGGLNRTATLGGDNTTITLAVQAFVDDFAADYLLQGIVITRSVETLVFEAAVAGVPFIAPLTSSYGDFHGTVAHTTANVEGVTAQYVNCSWVQIVDHAAFNVNYLKAIDQNFIKAIRFYVLRDWFSMQSKDTEAQKYNALYVMSVRNIEKFAFELKKVSLT
jgi:hypothetical protein